MNYDRLFVIALIIIAIIYGVGLWIAGLRCSDAGGVLVRGTFWYECVQEIEK
jgi:uncharacterized membrane protein YiaA